ncbi:MAG: cation transporter, partial [Acidimicrobiia bacterium]
MAAAETGELERIDLPVQGMTCASCAARIEKGLGALPGVDEAHVNFATHRATVAFDPATTAPDELAEKIESLGYTVAGVETGGDDDPEGEELRRLRSLVVLAAALSIPLLLISMVPAFEFENWQWVALVLATPVILWAGYPF